MARKCEACLRRRTATDKARAACAGNASQAFRWLRDGRVDPAPVITSDGTPSVLMPDLLDNAVKKYSKRWAAFSQPVGTVSWNEEMHPITTLPLYDRLMASDIYDASMKFKPNTAQPCGMHPRHMALTCEEAKMCLAIVLQIAEAIGQYPSCMAHVEVPFIPQGPKIRP